MTTQVIESALSAEPTVSAGDREAILRVLSGAAFLIFFKSYLIAPLIPSLSAQFHASVQVVGLLIPAYLLPYGVSTLSIGRSPIGWADGRSCWRFWQPWRCRASERRRPGRSDNY